MKLVFGGPGQLLEDGKTYAVGEPFEVSTSRGKELLADWTIRVTVAAGAPADDADTQPAAADHGPVVDAGISHLTRAELNELASAAGIASPEGLPNKESVIEALTSQSAPEATTDTQEDQQ